MYGKSATSGRIFGTGDGADEAMQRLLLQIGGQCKAKNTPLHGRSLPAGSRGIRTNQPTYPHQQQPPLRLIKEVPEDVTYSMHIER